METMTKEPYVHHVPTMTRGVGYADVYNFYKNHFIGKMPNDTKIVCISRTVGKDQVVDELVLSFTHDREIDFILPGAATVLLLLGLVGKWKIASMILSFGNEMHSSVVIIT